MHTSKVTRGVLILFAGLGLLACCADSGTVARDTPTATAEAFVRAMKAERYDRVAEGFANEKMARSWHPDWENLSATERQTALSEARASHEALARELHAEFFRGKVWVSKTEISDREDGFAWAHFATASSGTFGFVLRWDGTVWKFVNAGYAGGLSQ